MSDATEWPPYSFVAVYRLSQPPPQARIEFAHLDGARLMLAPGPFKLGRMSLIHHYGSSSTTNFVAATIGIEAIPFPEGAFLLILHEIHSEHSEGQMEARIHNSELVALLDLEFNGLVGEKLFEGAVIRPGHFVLAPEGPVRLTGHPLVTSDQLSSSMSACVAELQALPARDRQRFRLMSHWYRRAQETLNRVDQFFFLYFAIEVFPASGTTDVPNAVRDFLTQRVFPDLEPFEVKQRLMLGPIASLRAEIVHDGKTSIAESEGQQFSEKLERLEAIAYECMGLLAGRPYSGSLDNWVRP